MRKTVKEMIEVMQAYADGKCIQEYIDYFWRDVVEPTWDWEATDYRIKPEPHYVPYDSVNEVERDKWVKRKGTSSIRRIDGLKHEAKMTPLVSVCSIWRSLIEMFDNWEYEDGTPFGRKAEE